MILLDESDAGSAGGYTIINSGTIEVTDKGANAIRLNNKVNNTITNTGSILGGPEQAFSVAGSVARLGLYGYYGC